MDPNKQKEEFQYAYVCALAAHAGLNRGDFRVDDDSADVTFQGKGYVAPIRNPMIQLQLKCTSQDLIDGQVIKFPLKRKNYDDLRGADVVAPKYLAVLLVPAGVPEWIGEHADHISLHNRCFWLSLREAPATENETSVTVEVPLAQQLTTAALLQMMQAASQGDAL